MFLEVLLQEQSYVMLSQEEVEALRKAVNFGLADISEEESGIEK